MTHHHTALHEISTHAALLDLTANDPFVRWGVPDPLSGTVLAGAGAVGVERVGRRGRGMWVIPHSDGGAAGVGEFLSALGAGPLAALGCTHLSVPQEYAGVLAQAFDIGPGGDWDWMWTTTLPAPVPHEDSLVVLDDTADAAELTSLAAAHSPTGEGDAGTGRSILWMGLRDAGGQLIASGAMQPLESGIPHLAGIVTHTAHRGRGLGRAVTAGLTRRALGTHGVCTLGMYSDNPSARAVYHGLGYRTAYAWCSRRLPSPVAKVLAEHA